MALGAALVATLVAGGAGTLQFIVQNETLKGVPMSCDQICQNASLVCDNSLQVAWEYDRWVFTAFRLLDTGPNRIRFCDDFAGHGKYEYGLPYVQRIEKRQMEYAEQYKAGDDDFYTTCFTAANNWPPPYLRTTPSAYPPCHYVAEKTGTPTGVGYTLRMCPCHPESPAPPPPVPPFLPDAAPAPPPPPPPQLPVPIAGWSVSKQPYSADFVIRPLGSAARSCDAICHERQMRCDEYRQWRIRDTGVSNSVTEYYFSLANHTCDSWLEIPSVPVPTGMFTYATGTPYSQTMGDGNVRCYTQKNSWPCAAEPINPNSRRLCACNPHIPPSPPAPPWLPPPPPSPPSPPPDPYVSDRSGMWEVFAIPAMLMGPFFLCGCCLLCYGDTFTKYTGIDS